MKQAKIEQQAIALRAVEKEVTTDGNELFHDSDRKPWAHIEVNGHFENHSINSRTFEQLVTRALRKQLCCMPPKAQVKDTIREFEGMAMFDGRERQIALRVAGFDDRIYIDLANDAWECVEISKTGWKVVSNPPVRFRRPDGMRPLPTPRRGGSVNELFNFLNIKRRDHQILTLAWLVSSLRPSGPYPICVMHGSQGSAKSTTQTFLRNLIDPSIAALCQAPRDERDLSISAMHSHVLAFDNFSSISNWLSDALCRLSTGSGFSTRQLYTDTQQIFFSGQRPIMLNGISHTAERADLLDRVLLFHLPKINGEDRVSTSQLSSKFKIRSGFILGALFDAVSTALREYTQMKSDRRLSNLPRMADFCLWSAAASSVLGFSVEEFLSAYELNRNELKLVALENSNTVQAVIQWFLVVSKASTWQGTCKDLLSELHRVVGKQFDLPRSPEKVAAELKRAEPNLHAIGVKWEDLKREAGTGRRIHRLSLTHG